MNTVTWRNDRPYATMAMNDDGAQTEPPSSPDAATDLRKPAGWRRWFKGLRNGRNGGSNVRETLEELIEQHEEREDPIDSRERQLIDSILTVGALTVNDVMVPRADIVAVECSTSLNDVVEMMSKEAHSRLPVYRETLDEVIGMVHIKDVFPIIGRNKTAELTKLVREVLFVSPSMRVLDLLLQMRLSRTHMALVVDEYGGIDGLVTIEDAVEQIVGEIEDEHDDAVGPSLQRRNDGTVIADARYPLDDFEDEVCAIRSEEEREEDIDTLGGLVFSIAGRVPMRGEVVCHEPSGVEFEVIEADPRRIRRLRLGNLPASRLADE